MSKNSIYFRDIDPEVIERYLRKNYKSQVQLMSEMPNIMKLRKLMPFSSLQE